MGIAYVLRLESEDMEKSYPLRVVPHGLLWGGWRRRWKEVSRILNHIYQGAC